MKLKKILFATLLFTFGISYSKAQEIKFEEITSKMKEYESIISTTCMKTELIATENKITISYTYNDTNDECKHRDYDYIKEYANDWKTTYIYENGKR